MVHKVKSWGEEVSTVKSVATLARGALGFWRLRRGRRKGAAGHVRRVWSLSEAMPSSGWLRRQQTAMARLERKRAKKEKEVVVTCGTHVT